ncbi:hypothetical protein diail_1039 [Diaporthe ilicicola]|nr:hypothetical protein diail_1039 [Diaporthe ilicicola]
MADDLKKDNNEGQHSQEMLKLDTLPNEIISQIATALTVDPQAPYRPFGPKCRTAADRKEQDDHARRHLGSLCLVSKQMYSSAREALYRNILMTDANSLILLYRTFLESPELSSYVKQMSLNILQESEYLLWEGEDINTDNQINLTPLLSCARSGLEKYRKSADAVGRMQLGEQNLVDLVELLYDLQFRVMSHTNNLESLNFNVHPYSLKQPIHGIYDVDKFYLEAVSKVLSFLWGETAPCLSRLKQLQLIGSADATHGLRARSDFVALLFGRFLTLPKLECFTWYCYVDGWWDVLSDQAVMATPDCRYKAIRTLELVESSYIPPDLAALCYMFPKLESLSVYTHSVQGRSNLTTVYHPEPSERVKYLTDSLASLENLSTLDLGLHYPYDIRRALGPSETLSLESLANLQTLTVPFHFFLQRQPEGQCEVLSPASVLPRPLKSLNILACIACLHTWLGKSLRQASSVYRHQDVVLEFLEGIAEVRVAIAVHAYLVIWSSLAPFLNGGILRANL